MKELASKGVFENAKQLRSRMTIAEKILWNELRNKKVSNYKFRRQHPVASYILGFYCYELRLGIEVDGEIHDKWDQKEYDKFRTIELLDFDIRIIRLKNSEVIDRIDKVIESILVEVSLRKKQVKLIDNLSTSPRPLSSRRGVTK